LRNSCLEEEGLLSRGINKTFDAVNGIARFAWKLSLILANIVNCKAPFIFRSAEKGGEEFILFFSKKYSKTGTIKF